MIEEIEKNSLIKESARKGEILQAALLKLKEKFPERISWVLGKGLIAAVLLKDSVHGSPDSLFASKVAERCMQKGLLVVHTGRESIKIGPPLTISDDALVEGVGVLGESIQEIDKI